MAQETFVIAHKSSAVALMPESQYQRIFVEDCFPHESGGVDYERAIRAGVRIFAFTKEVLASLPFVGTEVDLQCLISSRKIQVRRMEVSFYVPFIHPLHPDKEFKVTADDFRLHFGPDCWTSIFGRQR